MMNSPVNGWNVCVETVGGGGTAMVWFERFVNSTGISTPKTPIAVGTFTHVVAVYSGALIIYTNGVRSFPTFDGRALLATTTAAYAGSAEGLSGHGFLGQLDEIAIYNKALTAAQVSAHYAAGKP